MRPLPSTIETRKTGVRKVLISVAILVLSCRLHAKAEILKVGVNLPFKSVSAALNSAAPGDIVRIFPGVYPGDIMLDKSVTLEGIERPVLHGSGKTSVIQVLAPACVIRGLVIEHSGGELQNEDSGILLKSNENLVENTELRDILFGIYLFQSSKNHIRENQIQGRIELEVGERGSGIHLWNSFHNIIEGNSIHETRDGLYIQNSSHNFIFRNHVSKLRYGLHYMSSDDNRFEENDFSYNIAGAAIMYSRGIQLRRNAFVHNRGVSSFGILFQGCDENVAEGNFIVDNGTGLFLEAVHKTAFRRNIIAANDIAMTIFSSSDDNLFTENRFVENLSPLQVVGKKANAYWYQGKRGNFWSEYDGYDLDGDGIGDIPNRIQNIFEYMEGNYPRLRLYLNSPIAQALALAEKTFPLIEGSSEIDPAPLMRAAQDQFYLEEMKASGSVLWTLAALSLTMLGTGVAVVGKGLRR